MRPVKFSIRLSERARIELISISDRNTQEMIRGRIRLLVLNPTHRGRPLHKELRGYYRIKAVDNRYRIIYRVYRDRKIVMVVFLGKRIVETKSDVYKIASKAVKEFENSEENPGQ